MATKHVLKLSSILTFFSEEQKAFTKGENAVESGHVDKMNFDAGLRMLLGSIHASMKNKKYNVKILLDESLDITSAECSCPRGIKCHHIAALLLFAHYNVSVTDKECTWRNPKSKSDEVVTCDDMYPKKAYRAIERKMTDGELKELHHDLASFGTTVGFSWLLQEDLAESHSLAVVLIEDIVSSDAFFSAQNKQTYLKEKCAVTNDVIKEVALQTIGQASNEKWLLVRKHRLTASNFGSVLAACSRNRFPESLFKSLAGMYNLEGVKAIQWGRTHENVAIENFEATTKLKVIPTGIWLTPSGLLGGSPDGLVDNDGIVEVNCPYTYREEELPEKLKNVKTYIVYFSDDGELHINLKHQYYHQIQGLLHILNRTTCYLIIWNLKGSIIATIKKDLTWQNNLKVLENFYINQYIPKLVQNIP